MIRRALIVLAALAIVTSAIELRCGAHTDVAVAARVYPSYKPAAPTAVVASVPPRDAREVAMRAQLRANPDRVEVAVALAKAEIQRARSLSDPRYLGRAQAILARWYDQPDPPPGVRTACRRPADRRAPLIEEMLARPT